jgi:hypothetical protein
MSTKQKVKISQKQKTNLNLNNIQIPTSTLMPTSPKNYKFLIIQSQFNMFNLLKIETQELKLKYQMLLYILVIIYMLLFLNFRKHQELILIHF